MKNTIKIFTVFIIIINFQFLTFAQEHPDFKIINEVKTTPVKNQGNSGTCWSFATTSFLETEIMRLTGIEQDLSEMYFVYNAYLTKAEYYVRLHGLGNFSQGGQAHDVINVIENEGLVSEANFSGFKIKDSYDHSKLETSLKNYLDSIIKINPVPSNWKSKFIEIINSQIGIINESAKLEAITTLKIANELKIEELPKTTKVEQEIYEVAIIDSNKESKKESGISINTSNYYEITSFNHHDFYTNFDLEVPDNWSHNSYLNLPVDEMMKIIDNALQNGYSVCWDGDVSEKNFNHRKGRAELTDADLDSITKLGLQQYRQITFENQTTTDDHLMHITGIATDNAGNKYYQTKNSWGDDSNKYGGYLYMSESFVGLKTIAILVNKDAISTEILDKIYK